MKPLKQHLSTKYRVEGYGLTACIMDLNNEMIIEVLKEISSREPRGVFPEEIHEAIIRKHQKCMDLYSSNNEWSPFIERAIQVLLDADLGYRDVEGRIHMNKLAEGLIAEPTLI